VGYVVSFQNGLNELVIADIVGRPRTVGAFINFGADYMSPGVVNFSGRGAFVLGELDGAITPRIEALQALARVCEPDAIVTDNILGYLWGKLGYGALLFATALTNASICDALAAPSRAPCFAGSPMRRSLSRERSKSSRSASTDTHPKRSRWLCPPRPRMRLSTPWWRITPNQPRRIPGSGAI
jgi:ketopantoate reductase